MIIKLVANTLCGLFFSATAVFAQNIGIDFKNMPVGTKIFFELPSGAIREETFLGKKGSRYWILDGLN